MRAFVPLRLSRSFVCSCAAWWALSAACLSLGCDVALVAPTPGDGGDVVRSGDSSGRRVRPDRKVDGGPGLEPDAGVPSDDAGSGVDDDGGAVSDGGPGFDASEPGDASDRADASDVGDAGIFADAGDTLFDAGVDVDAGELMDAGADVDAGALTDGGASPDPTDAGALDDGGPALDIASRCFPEIFDPTLPGPDYDQFSPVVGSHCYGTDHQEITGIERVVFLGDSVTVGSPPTLSSNFYRSILADRLAAHFALTPPEPMWKVVNLFSGRAAVMESGDFASCAEWGARTPDVLEGSAQIEDCLPADKRDLRTLIIVTVGGNDLAQVAQSGVNAPYEQSWAEVQAYVSRMRAAIEWIKAPGRFPNGVHVVFANTYEFTDATADLESCPAVDLGAFIGFADFENWSHPEWLQEFMVWANEEYMRIAVDTGSDMMFLFEHFCGHGFHADDPASPCYRGPGTARWFDLTCIHPNPTGHGRIADMFMEIVVE